MTDDRIMSLFESDITPDELVIRKAAFQAILNGVPMTQNDLITATSFTREKIEPLVEDLAKRGLIVIELDTGRIVGSWGLSFIPTSHKLQIRKRSLYTWCAEDAVGIPAALGEDARILSRCHECGELVNIEMTAGNIARVEPPEVHLWVAATEVGRSVVGYT